MTLVAPSVADDITTALNREDFRQWLVRLGDKEAGIVCESEKCPIARYLNLTTGHVVSVFAARVKLDGLSLVQCPNWARHFVIDVDSEPPYTPISAVACLEILDAIPA